MQIHVYLKSFPYSKLNTYTKSPGNLATINDKEAFSIWTLKPNVTRSYLYRNRLVDSVYCTLYASLLSRITFGISVRSANRLANKLEPFHFLFVGYLQLVPLFRSGALSRRCSDTAISTECTACVWSFIVWMDESYTILYNAIPDTFVLFVLQSYCIWVYYRLAPHACEYNLSILRCTGLKLIFNSSIEPCATWRTLNALRPELIKICLAEICIILA